MKTFKQYIEEQSVRDELPSYDELDLRSRMQVDQDDYEGGPPVPPGGDPPGGDPPGGDDDDFSDFAPKPKKPNGGFTYTDNWWENMYNAWMNSPSAWNPFG